MAQAQALIDPSRRLDRGEGAGAAEIATEFPATVSAAEYASARMGIHGAAPTSSVAAAATAAPADPRLAAAALAEAQQDAELSALLASDDDELSD